jgi:hypothetical protein
VLQHMRQPRQMCGSSTTGAPTGRSARAAPRQM